MTAAPSPDTRTGTPTDPHRARARRRETLLPVNEIFWHEVAQGEGPFTGRACAFIRLGYCNLHCPPCDTGRTWNSARYDIPALNPETPVTEIMDSIPAHIRMVVISGGEPLLWQRTGAFVTMLEQLTRRGIKVHIETNATIIPTEGTDRHVVHYSASPKLSAMGGGDPLQRRVRPPVIAAFAERCAAGRACFKFVVAGREQVQEAARFVQDHQLDPDWVWMMPEAGDAATLLARQPEVTKAATALGFNVSTRLHLISNIR
ncbi:7-carboxy-7-deazaguanine synthase QueE [Streptacidiphilus sp. EB103A]|uniref:7-carboxy-7-deazaguanine synthase QueE n=1 Tax=Streptacidiphilus sp. EB103A TaxID=3156275 RepID=UPI0035162948